jgi:hypothetical protein
MAYREDQLRRAEILIQEGFFDGDTGGGVSQSHPRPHALQDGLLNLYPAIRQDALEYYKQNDITWRFGDGYPPTNVLSPQVACLNHLFPLRQSQKAALGLVSAVSGGFAEMLPIEELMPGLIMFDAVGGDLNYLNEGINKRGGRCTSIDALMRAVHKDGRRFLILIDWQYSDSYNCDNKSAEKAGKKHLSNYGDLIEESRYLNLGERSCFWFEPFFHLMRQTLWAEQIIRHQIEGFEAEDFLHLHVIPEANARLHKKRYQCSGLGLEATWKKCLRYPDNYLVVSPEKLWSGQDQSSDLFNYLKKRYW